MNFYEIFETLEYAFYATFFLMNKFTVTRVSDVLNLHIEPLIDRKDLERERERESYRIDVGSKKIRILDNLIWMHEHTAK